MATQKSPETKPLAIITGASSGIGRELAAYAAQEGFHLLVAADTPLDEAIAHFQALGATVEAVQCDLATKAGLDELVRAPMPLSTMRRRHSSIHSLSRFATSSRTAA